MTPGIAAQVLGMPPTREYSQTIWSLGSSVTGSTSAGRVRRNLSWICCATALSKPSASMLAWLAGKVISSPLAGDAA